MSTPFWILRTTAAQSLMRTHRPADAIAEAMRALTLARKQGVQQLVAAGVPLRFFLAPYVDTVLLDPRTPSYYFGGRILLCGTPDPEQLQTARSAGFAVQTAANADELRALLRIRAPHVSRTAPSADRAPDAKKITLVDYTFPAGRIDPFRRSIEIRAQSRAVLAFGEILGRVIAQAGGEILLCAEDELLIAWPDGEPEAMTHTVQSTYAVQLAPVLGGAVSMHRAIYREEV